MSRILKLRITQDDVDAYNKQYFLSHPRAKKKPIEKPFHPSLNQWMIINNRMVMNTLKQNWKEFAVFWCKRHGLVDMGLDDYAIEEVVYKPTRARSDPDNYSPKFLLDGFVEAGFLVDDDGKHMRALIIRTDYDKDNPRTEINVRIFDKGE